MGLKAGYKSTEVGVIPEDWAVKPLRELGKFKNGINKGKKDFGHGFPFINLMDVFGIPKVSASTSSLGLVNSSPTERKLYELKTGDVLFVRSSVKPEGVGLTTLIPQDLPETVFSGFLIRFRDTGLLEHGFKEYCFWDERFRARLISNSTVSANTNINQGALKRLLIAFPPKLTEQRAIATALSDVDGLLGGLDRLIVKKLDLKRAAMQQLLNGQTRLPGFHDVWQVKRLGDVGVFFKGSGIKKDEVVADGLPCIRYGEIYTHHNDHVRPFSSFVTPETARQSTRLAKGDLLFAGSGETAEEIGKCVAYLWDDEAYAGGDIVILRPSGQSSAYLGYLLNHSSIVIQKARLGQGDAVVHISASNLASVELHLPKVPEQTAIAAVLADMDAELAALEQRREKTRGLKQAMMHELLIGRTRLISPKAAHA